MSTAAKHSATLSRPVEEEFDDHLGLRPESSGNFGRRWSKK